MRIIIIYDENATPVQPHEEGTWILEGNATKPDGWLLILEKDEQRTLLELQKKLTEVWPTKENSPSWDDFQKAYLDLIDFFESIPEEVNINPAQMQDITDL